jgi:hypothetical protein
MLRATEVARIDVRRRRIAFWAMVAILVNALCPFLEAFAAPGKGNANYIEICSSTGIKRVPATDEVRLDGAGTKGGVPAQVRGKRDCALCPVTADAPFILPPTVSMHTAAPATLPRANASHAAFVPYTYRQSLRARGPPAHSLTPTLLDAMSGAESNNLVAAHPARDHARIVFHGMPAAGIIAAHPRFEKSVTRNAAAHSIVFPIECASTQASRSLLSLPSNFEPHCLDRATKSESS